MEASEYFLFWGHQDPIKPAEEWGEEVKIIVGL
jgi:hypothetical protein